MHKVLIFAAMLSLVFAWCSNNKDQENRIDYSDSTYWYSYENEGKPADVFYIYPTVATISYADNNFSWYASIESEEVMAGANENQRFNKMLYGDYNFFAPYYRQMIFEVYTQPFSVIQQCETTPAKDVIDAFNYYMEHFNNGRPFFLVGHSQGSQLLLDLLKYGMSDEQRSQMVAAYCIGYRVTEDDLNAYPGKLLLATDSTETGKIVMFNSVTDTSAISFVSRGNVFGVNPLTWTTDTTFVPKEYHLGLAKYSQNSDSVLIIPQVTGVKLCNNHAVCTDLSPDFVFIPAFESLFPLGNLHFADSWLFGGNVVENMRCRLNAYFNGTQK